MNESTNYVASKKRNKFNIFGENFLEVFGSVKPQTFYSYCWKPTFLKEFENMILLTWHPSFENIFSKNILFSDRNRLPILYKRISAEEVLSKDWEVYIFYTIILFILFCIAQFQKILNLHLKSPKVYISLMVLK